MDPYFEEPAKIELKDLDDYIYELIEPIDKSSSIDSETQKMLLKKEEIDYTQLDEEFELQKGEYEKRRNYIKYITNPASQVDKLALKILALKTFYNTYRNLEGLDSEKKLIYLDKILEHHIDCNLELIRFFTEFTKNKDFSTIVG